MRIVHFVSSLNIGGAEKLVCNLVKYQKRKGYEVDIISYGSPTDVFAIKLQNTKIKVHYISGSFLSRNKQVISICRNKDILHFHSSPVLRSLCLILPLWFFKKTIYTIHGETNPPLAFLKLAHTLSRPFLNTITAVSLSAGKASKERFNWSPEKITVIGNGVVIPCKKALIPKREIKIRLGVVARLIELKNISLIFSTLKNGNINYNMENISVEIFGDGPLLEQLKSEAIATNLNIVFHGIQPDENIIYSSIDVLLITSNTEGLPMTLIEAMANNIPVISTKVGAISSIITNQVSGLLIDVNSSQQLETAINYFIDNEEKIVSMTNNAQKIVRDRFSIDVISNIYEELYTRVQ
ncbi:glycosyltransferase family 4 protein [Colwellia sp. MB3u-70]|uniref:glycosyltransferase family 4 protein n=1 Tax=unclassified Colwellia TaxID=196834 RepID=UPI0015F616F1|nr:MULTISPECIES: glycosyltransferase family 4 protein [unclassified Colwellia]MBA6294078.1 glycosyltransferase family 4 protein [Colwellia sp. MB3u-8]MBA6307619.1 glycosyltransferase family 4 protein [Colwellia sp. MB3u-70]